MARYIEVKKPWGDDVAVNVEHISYVIADTSSAPGEGSRNVVLLYMLTGDCFTADVPYAEFMKLLVPISLSGDK